MITIMLVTLILINLVIPNRVSADYAASSQDPDSGASTGAASAGSASGRQTSTIQGAVNASTGTGASARTAIIAKIKEKYPDLDDDQAASLYSAMQDTNDFQVTYQITGSTTTGTLNFEVISIQVDQTAYDNWYSGNYTPSLASSVANANDSVSTASSDDDEDDIDGGLLFTPLSSLLVAITDGVNWIMEKMLIGQAGVTLSTGEVSGIAPKGEKSKQYMKDHNAPAEANATRADGTAELPAVYIKRNKIQYDIAGLSITSYRIGIFTLTPAEIFAGNVAALNANFFSTNTNFNGMLGGSEKSIVTQLRETVSSWYLAIRNIAIVGLLSVLLYLGIRIIISSSSNDKAKYKQTFMDWLIALCLIFFLHYIMAFTMTISEQVTSMLAGAENDDGTISQLRIVITEDDGVTPYSGDASGSDHFNRSFYSNFVAVARIKTQYANVQGQLGYLVMYIGFTTFTAYFVFIYLKRLLMLAFYTLMAPAVALSYPLDKLRDGKAQAFNFWLRDYIFYAFLPALHMILYTVFISSALDLAVNNMIYALVAMGFIVPAEKIVKKMFGIHGNTEDRASGFVGGALAGTLMSGIRKVSHPHNAPPPQGGKSKTQSRTRLADNPNSPNFMDTMNAAGQQQPALDSAPTPSTEAAATGAVAGIGAATMASGNETGNGRGETAESNGRQTSMPSDYEATQFALEQGNNDPQNFEQYPQPVSAGNNLAGAQTGMQTGTQTGRTPNRRPNASYTPSTKPKEKRSLMSNAKKAVGRRYKMAGGWKGIGLSALKTGGKAVAKGLPTVIGAGTLGAVGLGMGLVGGDFKDAFQAMGVGAAAGAYVGGNFGDAVNNTFAGRNELGRFASEVRYGSVEEADYARSKKEYVKDNGNRARILADHPEFSAQQLDDYANREYQMMYDSNTDDVKMADKAIALEDALIEQGMSEEQAHTSAYGALNAAQKYSFSDLADESKRTKYEKQVAQRAMDEGGVSEDVARTMAKNYFDNMAVLRGAKSIPKPTTTEETQQRIDAENAQRTEEARRQAADTSRVEHRQTRQTRQTTETPQQSAPQSAQPRQQAVPQPTQPQPRQETVVQQTQQTQPRQESATQPTQPQPRRQQVNQTQTTPGSTQRQSSPRRRIVNPNLRTSRTIDTSRARPGNTLNNNNNNNSNNRRI